MKTDIKKTKTSSFFKNLAKVAATVLIGGGTAALVMRFAPISNINSLEDDLVKKIAELTKQQNELNLQIEKLTNSLDEIILKIAELNKNRDDFKKQIEELIKIQNELKAQIEELKDEVKRLQERLENTSYKKIDDILVDKTQHVFDEYNSNYWYLFLFEFYESNLGKSIIGTLERPSNLSSDVVSHNVAHDFTKTSSITMIFNPKSNTLEAQDWQEKGKTIKKITIYQKLI